MTIGDVLAAIAALFVLGATWAATLLLALLAFPRRAARAAKAVEARPWACAGRGLGLLLLLGIPALALGQHPAGPVRLVAGALWATLGAGAALGGAGLIRIIGERIAASGAAMSPFACQTRGAVLYVAAGFLPIIGWLLIAPAALLLSLGAAAGREGRVVGAHGNAPSLAASPSPVAVTGSEAPA